MIEFRLIFQKAFAGEEVRIPHSFPGAANNLRQRFYRYRDKVREDASDEFNLLVDYLHFELQGRELVISYNNPNEKLLEIANDQQSTGERSLNLSKQPFLASEEESNSTSKR